VDAIAELRLPEIEDVTSVTMAEVSGEVGIVVAGIVAGIVVAGIVVAGIVVAEIAEREKMSTIAEYPPLEPPANIARFPTVVASNPYRGCDREEFVQVLEEIS